MASQTVADVTSFYVDAAPRPSHMFGANWHDYTILVAFRPRSERF